MQNQKRAVPAVLAVLMAGLFASGAAMAQPKKTWITVGDKALTHLQREAPQVLSKESKLVRSSDANAKEAFTEKVHLVEVDEEQMATLSAVIHKELKRCGGFMFHASEAEGRKALARQATPPTMPPPAPPTPSTTRPSCPTCWRKCRPGISRPR